MNIRKATHDDLPLFLELNSEVQEIHARAEPTLFKPVTILSQEDFNQLLSDPALNLHFAFENQCPVGYLFYEIRQRKETPYTHAFNSLYIHHIVVKRTERGKGFGKQLLIHAIEMAEKEGIPRIELDTWSFNSVALSFFKSFGFKTFNERLFLRR